MYKKVTLRRLPPRTRAVARLINELESTARRLSNRLEDIRLMEMDSSALYKRWEVYSDAGSKDIF